MSKKDKSKFNHLKSVGHKILDKSFIKRCNIENPNTHDIDEIMKRYINIYKKTWRVFV